MLKFYVKVFLSVFVKPLLDFIPVWHGDRYWSKILCGPIPIPLYGPKVKVIYLKFMCKCFVFPMSVFAKSLMNLIPDWHYDRNLSKIFHSTIPTPVQDLKVKVTHLEFLFMSPFAKPLMDLIHVWHE